MHRPFRSGLRSIVAINVHLMTSAACGFIAWAAWPTRAEWWGFGLMSIILVVGAFVGLGKALIAAGALYRKQRAIHDYVSQGSGPKPARMASQEDLRRAGMLDD